MRRRTVLSMLLLWPVSATGAQGRGNGRTTQQRAKQYADCRTARERLLFCISAIDDGIVDLQTSVDELKVLFGEDFTDLGPVGIDGASHAAMVSFERAPRAPDAVPSHAKAPEMLAGWYLQIKYDNHRRVVDYSLSDTHKGVPKRSLR